ncbi:rab-GTPase-TBC domain-containing protein [Dichotomopilus funicola]|uniref:Rab-GTPase-TBC domain-containing protein n=1 Tax=Dichotomopilus funicola TaxID=1934379 RepID=A0AAN6V5I3_9PEZI|nr:rab-GTPase-TBC domain-containing protein [Dichotomopilus funicola]
MTLRNLNQFDGVPSPTREPLAPPGAFPSAVQLHPPPSPSNHRTLRRLQSAHSLGAKAAAPPSLISQQRVQQQQQRQRQQQQPQQQLSFQNLNQHLQQRYPPAPARNHANTNRSPQRGRSNSDAPPIPNTALLNPATMTATTATRRSALGRRSLAADAMSLEKLIREGPPDGDIEVGQELTSPSTQSSLRIYVWLILLNAPMLETDNYLALIHRGASPAYSKIRNDTFRTLSTDPLFRRRVSEASLIRLLNAFAWTLYDARGERTRDPSVASSSRKSLDQSSSRPGTGYGSDFGSPASSPAAKRARALTLTTEGSVTSVTTEPGTYVQGMNVLAAPFLYAARSEAEAYVAFHQLMTKECPGYIRGAMDGVHKGLALLDKVLAIVDPKLSFHLLSKNLSAEIYAFPSVLTLCACTPPLPEVLRLWDFLFAYGPHLNILCIVAQLVMIRTEIMESPSPNKLLRSFPALQADRIKATTLAVTKMIPDDVYAEIVAHAR